MVRSSLVILCPVNVTSQRVFLLILHLFVVVLSHFLIIFASVFHILPQFVVWHLLVVSLLLVCPTVLLFFFYFFTSCCKSCLIFVVLNVSEII